MNILEEIRSLSDEEKQELLKELQTSEKKPQIEPISLGNPPRNPHRIGPGGVEISEEQWYDMTFPPRFAAPGKVKETIQSPRGTKTILWKPGEREAYNDAVMEEWIQTKREYARKHNLVFSDEYNPPEDPYRRH